MSIATTEYKISDGPSADTLEREYAENKLSRFQLKFANLERIDVSITFLEHEDGSGQNFNLEGTILGAKGVSSDTSLPIGQKIKGFYTARTRESRGTFRLM